MGQNVYVWLIGGATHQVSLMRFSQKQFSMRVNEFVVDRLVQEFYGLDPETMLVESVSITKSGKMHRWTWEHGYVVGQMAGESMQAEVTRIFGLTYLVAVQPDASVDLRMQVIRGLKTTAKLLASSSTHPQALWHHS